MDWSEIIEPIEEGKCVLIIGPEIYRDDNETLEEKLYDYLDVPNNPNIRNYYREDGLFLFMDEQKKNRVSRMLKKFYKQPIFLEAESIMTKLAQIPFSAIISINNDMRLLSVFDRMGFDHDASYYWKNNNMNDKKLMVSKGKPLIYNLFGRIDQRDSLILTHDDLFDYFESIFPGGKGIPEKLKQKMVTADNFIFLGLDFKKWYMQLLLRLLHVHNTNQYDFFRFAANVEVSEQVRTLCFEQFNIEFIPKNIKEFVDELYKECKNQKLTKEFNMKKLPVEERLKEIKNLLASSEFDKAFFRFENLINDLGKDEQDYSEDLIMLRSKYKRNARKLRQGIISHDESERENAKVNHGLLSLLKEIQAEFS